MRAPAGQIVQVRAIAVRRLEQLGLALRAQPAGAKQRVDIVWQDHRRANGGVLRVRSGGWIGDVHVGRRERPPAGQEDVDASLDLIDVAQAIRGDDGLQVDTVPIGDVGQPIAGLDRVHHAIRRRDEQVLPDQEQIGVVDVVRPDECLGTQLVLLGNLPQHFAGRDDVVHQARADGRRGRWLGDAREGRRLGRDDRRGIGAGQTDERWLRSAGRRLGWRLAYDSARVRSGQPGCRKKDKRHRTRHAQADADGRHQPGSLA